MKKIKAVIIAILMVGTLSACEENGNVGIANGVVSSVSNLTEVATVFETTEATTLTESLTEDVTSVEPVESVSDTEAIEEVENTHWDTIVYDTTSELDATDWWEFPDGYGEHNDLVTFYTISEALNHANVPDEVTSYLYEHSEVYRTCVDNDAEVRNMSSGVKDFDLDGVSETLYAVNYYDIAWASTDIVIYNEIDGVVYWSGNDTDLDTRGLMNVGCYFTTDPAAGCQSMWVDSYYYENCITWEDDAMYFTDDNVFIACDWRLDKYNGVSNDYYRVISDNGIYHIEYVGSGIWRIREDDTTDNLYRITVVSGDIPCILIQ